MIKPGHRRSLSTRSRKFIVLPLHQVRWLQQLARNLLTFNQYANVKIFAEVVSSAEAAVIVRTLNLCHGGRRIAAKKIGVRRRLQFLIGGAP